MSNDSGNHDRCQRVEITPSCRFESSVGAVGTIRARSGTASAAGWAAGWSRHTPLSLAVHDEFVVSVVRNDYTHGLSFVAAGVLPLDDEGRISEGRTMESAHAWRHSSGRPEPLAYWRNGSPATLPGQTVAPQDEVGGAVAHLVPLAEVLDDADEHQDENDHEDYEEDVQQVHFDLSFLGDTSTTNG